MCLFMCSTLAKESHAGGQYILLLIDVDVIVERLRCFTYPATMWTMMQLIEGQLMESIVSQAAGSIRKIGRTEMAFGKWLRRSMNMHIAKAIAGEHVVTGFTFHNMAAQQFGWKLDIWSGCFGAIHRLHYGIREFLLYLGRSSSFIGRQQTHSDDTEE